MSRGLNNSAFRALRDYGATSNTNSAGEPGGIIASGSGNGRSNNGNNSGGNIANVPDVNFAGFSPTEFMTLSENIAQNIGSVKTSRQTLEKALKKIGTPNDNVKIRDEA